MLLFMSLLVAILDGLEFLHFQLNAKNTFSSQ